MGWDQGEVSIIINRPVTEVFTYAEDVENLRQWAGVDKAEITAGKEQQLGSQLKITTTILGKRLEANSELVAYEPNRLTTYRNSRPFPSEITMIYEPLGTRTRVTRRISANPGNLFRATYPLIKRKMAKEAEKMMTHLKELLECQITETAH